MRIEKATLMQGSIWGIVISCINTLSIIISLYKDLSVTVYYGIIISALVAFLFCINQKLQNLILSFFVSVVTFIIAEIIIGQVVVNLVFKHIYDASAVMWAGDGFGMLVVTLFNITGNFLGFILSLIITVIKKMIKSL